MARATAGKVGIKLLKVKLWSLDKAGDDQLRPIPMPELKETETECQLEDILVSNPDLLLPGLKLVGRQMAAEGGPWIYWVLMKTETLLSSN